MNKWHREIKNSTLKITKSDSWILFKNLIYEIIVLKFKKIKNQKLSHHKP